MSEFNNRIPTILLSELNDSDRDKYFQLLLENDLEFQLDDSGYYVATIRVLNPKVPIIKESRDVSPRVTRETFSSKQKSMFTDSLDTSSSRISRQLKTPERKRGSTPTPVVYPHQLRGISDLLEEETKQNTVIHKQKLNGGDILDYSKITNKKEEPKQPKSTLKQFVKDCKFNDLLHKMNISTAQQVRPKVMTAKNYIQLLSEVYNTKYKKVSNILEEEILTHKGNSKENVPFSDFVVEFLKEKFKTKRIIEQNGLNLAASTEALELEVIEAKLFGKFLTGEYDNEDLMFFLFIRNTISKELKIQFRPRYPGEKIEKDSRSILIPYKQVMKIINSVLGEVDTLKRSFEKIVDHFLSQGTSRDSLQEEINLAQFLDLFIQWYHDRQPESVSPPIQNSSRPVFTDETFSESVIHERTDFHDLDESEIMRSFEIDNTRSKISDSSRQYFKDSFDTFKPQSVTNTRNPIQELKIKCIEYTENSLVEQFISIILSGFFEIPREKLEDIKLKAITDLNAKMKSLIEAAFDGEKRKWMETLGLPPADKEGLKYVEGIQKSIRELYKKGVNSSTNEDIDSICKSILQTPQLRSDMGKLLSSLTIQYSR